MMKFTIGGAALRVEDRRLLVGQGCYTDDIDLRSMVHGYVLRSPHAHARLLKINTTPASAHPGVVCILTAENYRNDGYQAIPYGLSEPRNSQGVAAFLPPRLPLADKKVRFVGDPIAFIVADTRDNAKTAAELVEIEYEPLQAAVDTATAASAESPVVWDERPGNVCFMHEGGNPAAVDAAFTRAHSIVRGRFTISRIAVNPMEPRGCVASHDTRQELCTVHAGVQDVYTARATLAMAFGEAEATFRVVSPDVGGSFGLKGVDPELILTAWASRRLRRPVKWIADRSEAFLGDNHGRDNVTEAELALDASGVFLALRVHTFASVGAYPSPFASASPINNLGSLAGVYRTPAIHVRVTGVFTNANPTGPYRGAGRPESSYVIERMADLAARDLGLDRAEIRRRNMIPPGAMPFKTGLTYTYDCGEFEQVMDKALEIAGYAAFESRRAESKKHGKLRGIGIATVIERAGFVDTLESANVQFLPSGDALVVAGSTDQGQGHKTMYSQILCDRLGLEPSKVKVIEADTARLATGGMTGSSRVSAMGSAALLLAVEKVITKGRKVAAHLLEAAEDDIEFAHGRFTVAGTDRVIALRDVVMRAFKPALLFKGLEPGLSETGTYRATQESFPNGCHVCELEIDAETGRAEILRYIVVDDVGTVINQLGVKGQIHGGVAQGIGQALMESVAYESASGQLLTGSFMDYCMPRADDLCPIEISTHSVPTAANPLGAKGAGEAGTVGALPAAINAVVDALSPFGVRHLDMPATSQAIWRAMQSGRTKT